MLAQFKLKKAQPASRRLPHRSAVISICMALLICTAFGCDVEKVDGYFRGPSKLSGKNAAVGGINYTRDSQASNKEWDQQISVCRLDKSEPGSTAIRFGRNANDMPLTVQRDDSGAVSFALALPDGKVTGASGDNCTVKLTLNPSGPTSSGQAISGETRIACTKDGRTVNGSARFERCGN